MLHLYICNWEIIGFLLKRKIYFRFRHTIISIEYMCISKAICFWSNSTSYGIELSGTACSSFFSETCFRFRSDHNHSHALWKRIKWGKKKKVKNRKFRHLINLRLREKEEKLYFCDNKATCHNSKRMYMSWFDDFNSILLNHRLHWNPLQSHAFISEKWKQIN